MQDIFYQNDLSKIEIQIWTLLQDGLKSSKTPFHTGSVATINRDIPEQRTVVLRQVDVEQKILSFNTDIRAEKIADIQANNNLTWLFYDAVLKLQLRIYTKAEICQDAELVTTSWQNSRLESKMSYATQTKSGSFIDTPEPIAINPKDVEPALLEFAKSNFCVVQTTAYAMDFVFLNSKGNKRGYFDYLKNTAQWRQV